jgi:hypothetical protein
MSEELASGRPAGLPTVSLTPAQSLAAAERLYLAARELKAAALRAVHPEWTEAEVERAVREAFLRGRP